MLCRYCASDSTSWSSPCRATVFPDPPVNAALIRAKVAAAVDDVMAQLGYDRYVAQGGDWGAIVIRYLGEHFASRAVAIHTNMLFSPIEADGPDVMAGVTEAEVAAIVTSAERHGRWHGLHGDSVNSTALARFWAG